MPEEKKEALEKINKAETIKLQVVNTLRDTTRLCGEIKINAEAIEDDSLKEILKKFIPYLELFNKDLAYYLSK